MPLGKGRYSISVNRNTKVKAPGWHSGGFLFGWLSLFSTVQPFDDVVAGYTSRNSR